MATYNQVKDFIITTDANSNKNASSATYVYSQAAITVPAGNYTTRTYNVPLSRDTRLYQIYVNLSIDGDVWTAMPCRDRFYSNNRTIAMNISQSGNNIVLNAFYLNSSASSQTFPAMDVSVTRRDFVDEI